MMYDLTAFYEANPRPAPKGSLTSMVNALLMDPNLTYDEIVARVRESHPNANTTTRSVASVACVLRSKGVSVPLRQKVRPRQLALI